MAPPLLVGFPDCSGLPRAPLESPRGENCRLSRNPIKNTPSPFRAIPDQVRESPRRKNIPLNRKYDKVSRKPPRRENNNYACILLSVESPIQNPPASAVFIQVRDLVTFVVTFLVTFVVTVFEHFLTIFLAPKRVPKMGPKTSSTLFKTSCVCRKCHFRKTQFSVLRVWADI